MQTARFFYLAATGRLLEDRLNDTLLEILSQPELEHKFVKGLEKENPDATIYRKSGTWKQFHADSGIVVADNYSYIIVAIIQDPRGEQELQRLIRAVEATMRRVHPE
jgi:beta-lactamase class A